MITHLGLLSPELSHICLDLVFIDSPIPPVGEHPFGQAVLENKALIVASERNVTSGSGHCYDNTDSICHHSRKPGLHRKPLSMFNLKILILTVYLTLKAHTLFAIVRLS